MVTALVQAPSAKSISVPGLAEAEARAKAPSAMGISVPSLAAEAAVDILSTLLEKYNQPEFQVKLYRVVIRYDARSLAYREKMSELLGSERAGVLAAHGFPAGPEGDAALLLALAEFRGHPEVEMLTACIDELLYTIEGPMVQGSKNLSKRQVLACCRAQIAAFSTAEFQRELQLLKAANKSSSTLTLRLQGRILSDYGLEANYRGMHSLLHQVAQYIMDPEVAACATAVNALLGMDADARASFNRRLVDISAEDPGPRVAKSEKTENARAKKKDVPERGGVNVKSNDGTTTRLEVPSDLRGADLKQLICERTEAPVERQRLIFRGKVVKDEDLIGQHITESGQTLHMVSEAEGRSLKLQEHEGRSLKLQEHAGRSLSLGWELKKHWRRAAVSRNAVAARKAK